MLPFGTYRNQDISWLRQHQVELRNCLSAITLGQSYAIGDKTITRANYPSIAEAMALVTQEIRRQEDIENGVEQPSGRVFSPDFSGLN